MSDHPSSAFYGHSTEPFTLGACPLPREDVSKYNVTAAELTWVERGRYTNQDREFDKCKRCKEHDSPCIRKAYAFYEFRTTCEQCLVNLAECVTESEDTGRLESIDLPVSRKSKEARGGHDMNRPWQEDIDARKEQILHGNPRLLERVRAHDARAYNADYYDQQILLMAPEQPVVSLSWRTGHKFHKIWVVDFPVWCGPPHKLADLNSTWRRLAVRFAFGDTTCQATHTVFQGALGQEGGNLECEGPAFTTNPPKRSKKPAIPPLCEFHMALLVQTEAKAIRQKRVELPEDLHAEAKAESMSLVGGEEGIGRLEVALEEAERRTQTRLAWNSEEFGELIRRHVRQAGLSGQLTQPDVQQRSSGSQKRRIQEPGHQQQPAMGHDTTGEKCTDPYGVHWNDEINPEPPLATQGHVCDGCADLIAKDKDKGKRRRH